MLLLSLHTLHFPLSARALSLLRVFVLLVSTTYVRENLLHVICHHDDEFLHSCTQSQPPLILLTPFAWFARSPRLFVFVVLFCFTITPPPPPLFFLFFFSFHPFLSLPSHTLSTHESMKPLEWSLKLAHSQPTWVLSRQLIAIPKRQVACEHNIASDKNKAACLVQGTLTTLQSCTSLPAHMPSHHQHTCSPLNMQQPH